MRLLDASLGASADRKRAVAHSSICIAGRLRFSEISLPTASRRLTLPDWPPLAQLDRLLSAALLRRSESSEDHPLEEPPLPSR